VSHPVFDIRGRTALVTGSSRGIGRALAQGLLEAGCVVVLHGRDLSAVDRAAAELAVTADRAGSSVQGVAFDVTDEDAVTTGVARVEEAVGELDILVNNAGMQHRLALLDVPAEAWHRVIETNLTSAFLVGRAVARGMVARGRGKIVNVCSLQAELARPGIAPYAASKGGLKMLTKGMCADWGPSGLQVNGIGPGYFETELTRPLAADPRFDAWVRGRTPAGRWGRLEELVGAVLFLASPASDFVNGQVIYVDGGMSSVL
jgi:gluconate 5-dehydrogenase